MHTRVIKVTIYVLFFRKREIYQYLDEVDFNCDRTINSIKLQKIPEFGNDMNVECNLNIDGDVVGDVPK